MSRARIENIVSTVKCSIFALYPGVEATQVCTHGCTSIKYITVLGWRGEEQEIWTAQASRGVGPSLPGGSEIKLPIGAEASLIVAAAEMRD